ncbi:hypothetical protein HHK36_016410 [Tetracentron sinense]|uniref:Uncharacterized protein n=1 Tax=Tetracentron sinense TaxID=13715 RepID=A0A834Z3C8_TETSI|nr:hypothetical protein HHK36_016410 [Tetracentron sinense]
MILFSYLMLRHSIKVQPVFITMRLYAPSDEMGFDQSHDLTRPYATSRVSSCEQRITKMRSLSSLGIGLSLVFGCLLLALVAELYYLLWWKKRITNREVEDDYSSSSARELFYLFCWKRPSSLSSTALNPQELCNSIRITDSCGNEPDTQLHSSSSKDLLLKPFGEDGVEAELMRLHNLSGPPRFLFTIKEETKEDLESEDGKSRGEKSRKGSRSRSLSDLLPTMETPFLTPLSSPPFLTPPLTPMDCYNHHGFNPYFESSTDAEVNRIRFSPPPKSKFLKDAEEKLYRRKLMEEAEKRVLKNGGFVKKDVMKALPTSSMVKDEEDGSFITIIVGKNKERDLHHHLPQYPSSSSQLCFPLHASFAVFNSHSGDFTLPFTVFNSHSGDFTLPLAVFNPRFSFPNDFFASDFTLPLAVFNSHSDAFTDTRTTYAWNVILLMNLLTQERLMLGTRHLAYESRKT